MRFVTPECIAASRRWPPAKGQSLRHARDHRRSIDVFNWKWLERHVARAHPITPLLWFGPVIAFSVVEMLRSKDMLAALAWFAIGWLMWSLIEYALHRFLFHTDASTSDERLRAFLVHGYHHAYPRDRTRLVAPPLMSWPIAGIIGTVEYFVVGSQASIILFGGTAAGYLAYDSLHYYVHHFVPRDPVGRWLRQYHLLHHVDGSSRFGISSPLWDLVFGSYQPVQWRRSSNQRRESSLAGASSDHA